MAKINYGGKKTKKSFSGGPWEKTSEEQRRAKLGTEKNPARLRVQTEERLQEMAALLKEKGWAYTLELEPGQPEETADLERLLHPPQPVTVEKKVGRNEPCPCGSGKKYKNCCDR
ncbi:MAG: SEC-C domain-containing protein [Deltaproteobacteria bacterium]|nr:SEC-C domain-containing protein [Deltaproteobacteria bacterium]